MLKTKYLNQRRRDEERAIGWCNMAMPLLFWPRLSDIPICWRRRRRWGEMMTGILDELDERRTAN
jgi:hypothetical protein